MTTATSMSIEIVTPGMATTLQDSGRPGYAHLGVPTSGAVDRALASLVNRLVGNSPGATVIETCGGLTIRAIGHVLIATSAETAPLSLHPGDTCSVPVGGNGRLWHYVAVRGGIAVEPTLGSSSRDTLSKLGPPDCRAGDRLNVGPQPDTPILADMAPLPPITDTIRLNEGPRQDWFEPASVDALTSVAWSVTTSSRIGVRLAGVPIERCNLGELPSEGLVRGALQVPPDGNPVMMLSDHPTTGGYPVIAVVHPDDVAALAQHAPGSWVRFRRGGSTANP